MLALIEIAGARLLKLHFELFWYMYPSCIKRVNSNYCCIHYKTKQLQLTPWYCSLCSLSFLVFLFVPPIVSGRYFYNNLSNSDAISGNYCEDYAILVLQFSFAVSLICLCLNYVIWTHKNELVFVFNSALQMSRDKPYRTCKHGRKYFVKGTGDSNSRENASNLNVVEKLIFLLSAINPGLAMITVSIDKDPIFLVGKLVFTESFLSSVLFVSFRLFLLSFWLSEITRTLSMSIISFIITSHLGTYLKVILQGHYDTNKINRNSHLCRRVFDNECYLAYLSCKSVFKHIFVIYVISMSGLAAISISNYLDLKLSNLIGFSFLLLSFSAIITLFIMLKMSAIMPMNGPQEEYDNFININEQNTIFK